jgi:hypothetical protein
VAGADPLHRRQTSTSTASPRSSATLTGWSLLRELPDAVVWVGMALIAVSGVATAWLGLRRR